MPRSSARTNNATETTYSLQPFAEGAFRYVSKGHYTRGERKGQACVVKWFKSGCVFEASYYANDLKVVDKALEIISKWNDEGIIDKHIVLNKPEVWTRIGGDEEKQLVEPFIKDWRKFNSNSGWVSGDRILWNEVMQALSHYSYHATGGQIVLCDLQGGLYKDGAILTDPVILSRRRDYGVSDLGADGISQFFSQHRCNRYCRRHWQQPRYQDQYYDIQRGTTMVHVPTRHSYTPLTRIDYSD